MTTPILQTVNRFTHPRAWRTGSRASTVTVRLLQLGTDKNNRGGASRDQQERIQQRTTPQAAAQAACRTVPSGGAAMTVLSIRAAATAAGVDRRTIQRAIQAGRLSATTTASGERGVDLSELIRVFGELRQAPPSDAAQLSHSAAIDAAPQADLVSMLREQIQQAQERENRTWDQLQQAQHEKVRLLAMLEAEQQARRDLETKLLPAPRPAPAGKVRVWILLAVLAALVFAGWHFRAVIVSALVS